MSEENPEIISLEKLQAMLKNDWILGYNLALDDILKVFTQWNNEWAKLFSSGKTKETNEEYLMSKIEGLKK